MIDRRDSAVRACAWHNTIQLIVSILTNSNKHDAVMQSSILCIPRAQLHKVKLINAQNITQCVMEFCFHISASHIRKKNQYLKQTKRFRMHYT